MRIRLAIPDHLVSPQVLEAALETTSLANEHAIERGEIPGFTDALRGSGVQWRPEPFLDGEHFDLGHQVVHRGWGDCDDLAPWLAGELRASGEDPGAHPRVYRTGPNRWHVVVQTSDGQILDPSKWAGMGKRSGATHNGVHGTIARPFARRGNGALCCIPHNGRWWARADIPWQDVHLASHAAAPDPNDALERAISGAVACGEACADIDPAMIDRARDAAQFLLADRQEVGSFFGGLLKAALPIASSFIPGGSLVTSAATSALDALTHGGGGHAQQVPNAAAMPGGAVSVPIEHPGMAEPPPDHNQHMMLFYHPAKAPGPIVMRF